MDIKLLKFIIEHFSLALEFVKDVEKTFGSVYMPGFKNFKMCLKKILVNNTTNELYNEKIDYIIHKHSALFNSMIKYYENDNINMEDFVFEIESMCHDDNKAFIVQLDKNPEERSKIYKELCNLEKLGVRSIETDVSGTHGICEGDPRSDYLLLQCDYMNSLQIVTRFGHNHEYISTDKTNYYLKVSLYTKDGEEYLGYGSLIYIKDLTKFNTSDIPKTVEEFKKYVETIKNATRYYKELKDLERIKKDFKQFSDSVDNMTRFAGYYNTYNVDYIKEKNESMKEDIDNFYKVERSRVLGENRKQQSKKYRVRI